MTIFAVQYQYNDLPDVRAAALMEHRAFLAALAADGRLLGAGAYTGGVPGALLVFDVAGRVALDAVLASDPFAHVGLLASTDVREWSITSGPWAAVV